MSVQIISPNAGQNDYPVVVQGSGPGGIMYALVSAISRAFGPASGVWAKVYTPGMTVPQKHDGTAQLGAYIGNDEWCFGSLPCPQTAPSPGANLTLAAWAVFPFAGSGSLEIQAPNQPFCAVAATQTAGSCGSGASSELQSAGSSGVALSTVPLLWTLLVVSFGISKAIFNGNWILTFRSADGGYCVWDNGGDGRQTPRIELRCENPHITTWRLTFCDRSGPVVEYVRSAVEWNLLGPNVLRRTENFGAQDGTTDLLTVTPG